MDLKPRLLDLLERAYQEERAFVRGLSDEERAAVGTSTQWSARDLIAHVTAWKERTAQELEAVARGEPGPDFGSLDQFNAGVYEEHQQLPWSDVLDRSEQAYRRLYGQIEVASDDVLSGPRAVGRPDEPTWWLILGRGFNHPLGHLTERYAEQGRIDHAAGIQEEAADLLLQLDESATWQGLVHYGLARVYAGLGRTAEAIGALREAFRLNPALVERSGVDPRLASVREDPQYRSSRL